MHAQAAYIASLSTSLTPIQPSELTMQHLCDAIMKWWPVFTDADACPHCSQTLDIHGHHALMRHAGGDVVTRHNRLHDSFSDFCCRACLAPELERGCGLTSKKDRTRPADVLVPNWSLSRSAAFDLKAINPLNSNFLLGESMTSGYTAELGEKKKHSKNDIPCTERGWVCVPLVVEVFGDCGNEEQEALSRVAKKLAIKTSRFWPEVLASMCCLGITLMRQNARALLGRRSTSEVDYCLV